MAVAQAQASQAAPAAQLCEHCHQKAKFGNHQYCSKTCAAQAATLCNQCHKKPKFQNFDYCGKHCASVAAANGTKSSSRPAANVSTAKKGNSGNPAAGTIDPMQIAQLVVQHAPQIQSLLASVQGQGSASSAQPGGTQAPASTSSSNTGSTSTQQASKSSNGIRLMPFFSRGKKNAQPKLAASTKQSADDTRCSIPGCKQSVYVDEEGIVSEFCSLRHREEAVTSGLREPCIMCLVLPQGDSDYFCSRACLEESMNKPCDESDEEEEWNPAGSQN